ncbi:MAG: ClbS/DfsB family four-helix bundle protein [Anaerolineae bacterium]|nr:ClbS/DfsB family four-helix bundle protein [Anaerolineae bacterium]
MDKPQLIDLILADHARLDQALAQMSTSQMTEAGVQDTWSVKDILAHITAWEARLVTWLQAAARGETPTRPEPGATWDDIDRLNEETYRENRDRPLHDVLADYHHTYQKALKEVEALTDEVIVNPERFAWTVGRYPLWQIIAANTYEHYREHLEAINNWLEKGKKRV